MPFWHKYERLASALCQNLYLAGQTSCQIGTKDVE
nr:MAG TPA: hypothetical protein [Caudoviricetes sp.]